MKLKVICKIAGNNEWREILDFNYDTYPGNHCLAILRNEFVNYLEYENCGVTYRHIKSKKNND